MTTEEKFYEMCDMIRAMSEEDLATMPKELFDEIMQADILPKDLQDKLRRARIKIKTENKKQ